MNQWKGKKWYCYGTSMTDKVSLINGINCGNYSKYLAKFAGLEQHNFGKGGSGIITKFHGDDNIKTRCMRLDDGKGEADLITVEVIPNDMKGELGEATDLCDYTYELFLKRFASKVSKKNKEIILKITCLSYSKFT